MKISKYKYYYIIVFVTLLRVSGIFADLKLVIDPYRQWGYNTCWAAVSVMVLNAYGYPQEDEKLVRCWVYPDPSEENCNTSMGGPTDKINGLWGESKSVDQILQYFGSIYGHPETVALAQEEIAEQIGVNIEDLHKPFICGLLTWENKRHMVLGIGYYGSGIGSDVTSVIYNDPNMGREVIMDYLDFVYNDDFYWLETFILDNYPTTPIPTPIDPPDWVMITSGTGEITTSTTSLSYSASRGSSTEATWNWKLIFPHSSGYCTARSWTASGSTSHHSTWIINGFSMPAGFQWRYCCDGRIAGWAEVTVTYPENTMKSAFNVLYTPDNLYPGQILYANKLVSTSQPEVKAHELIVLENDQFNSGANIDFKSGGRINIKDDITITNGCSVDFIVDWSYW